MLHNHTNQVHLYVLNATNPLTLHHVTPRRTPEENVWKPHPSIQCLLCFLRVFSSISDKARTSLQSLAVENIALSSIIIGNLIVFFKKMQSFYLFWLRRWEFDFIFTSQLKSLSLNQPPTKYLCLFCAKLRNFNSFKTSNSTKSKLLF